MLLANALLIFFFFFLRLGRSIFSGGFRVAMDVFCAVFYLVASSLLVPVVKLFSNRFIYPSSAHYIVGGQNRATTVF